MSRQFFEGLLIAKTNYKVGKKLGEGQQGYVYEVRDVTQNTESSKLVIKLSYKVEQMQQEIKAISRANE